MDKIISLIFENIPWVFSGIGCFLLSLLFIRKAANKSNKQILKSGSNSTNYMSGKNININKEQDK